MTSQAKTGVDAPHVFREVGETSAAQAKKILGS
jgi:hypothetical protein